MKKYYIITVITSLFMVAIFMVVHFALRDSSRTRDSITVGFVYDGDESTPYTANFIKAQKAVQLKYGDKVKIYVKSNTSDRDGGDEAIKELINEKCDIIFSTSFGYCEAAKRYAGEYPDIQFCQATGINANEEPTYSNYHTFMGEIYQGRYISGVIAGMKLKEMIENGEITADQAKIGYVAAYPYAEVISGYTAFYLGICSEVPEAVMEVKYTNTWSNYSVEKNCADELISRGCVILSQHSDTTGPAIACESMYAKRSIYHIGYNQSMIDVAPTTSLLSSRINWEPYIIGACDAVFSNKRIEDCVYGNVHGNDIGAGFDKGWVEMLELNSHIAAPGSREMIDKLTHEFIKGRNDVFKGNYVGIDPNDEDNIYNLAKGYIENKDCSAPTFGYVLKDVITIIE